MTQLLLEKRRQMGQVGLSASCRTCRSLPAGVPMRRRPLRPSSLLSKHSGVDVVCIRVPSQADTATSEVRSYSGVRLFSRFMQEQLVS